MASPRTAFFWFIISGVWLALSVLPIHLEGDNLYAGILSTVIGLMPLPLFLYWNTKDYIWRTFNESIADDQYLNIFAFIWSHFSLGMCWSFFNLIFWYWNHDWYGNLGMTGAYSAWTAFIYGSFLALLGSGPAYVVSPTAPLTWILGALQSMINLGFALCGCGVIAAIHRQLLFNRMMPIAQQKSQLTQQTQPTQTIKVLPLPPRR